MKLITLALCCLVVYSKAEGVDLLTDIKNAGDHLLHGTLDGVAHALTGEALTGALGSFFGKRTENDITQTLHQAVNQVKAVLKSHSQQIQKAYKLLKNFEGGAKEFQTLLQQLKDGQNVDLYKIVNNVNAAVHSLTNNKRDVEDLTTAFQEIVHQLQHPYNLLHEHLLTDVQNHLHHLQPTHNKRTFLLSSLFHNLLSGAAPSPSNNNNNANTNTNININTNTNPSGDVAALLQALQQQQ